MRKFQRAFLLPAFLVFSSCQTPIGESWNHTVEKLAPDRTAEREMRYGLKPAPSNSGNTHSETTYLEPKKSPGPSPVLLKPFRSSSGSTVSPNKQPSPKPTPSTPKKSTATAPLKSADSEQKEDSVITEPASKPTPEPGPPPFASPVPGKKGYVTSPYSPNSGFIDVTGLEPGSEARDPYTGKVFRVP